MKKFIYRMQSVLDIKYKIEEQERVNYGLAKAKLIEEEKKLQVLVCRKDEYQQKFRSLVNDSLKVKEIIHALKAVDTMKDMIYMQIQVVKREEQLVEVARIRLNAAVVERKTQENLKEKAFEEFKIEYELEERKEIDELVSFQYSTKDAETGEEVYGLNG